MAHKAPRPPAQPATGGSDGPPAWSPTGWQGSLVEIEPGTNAPAVIDGRPYSGHAIDRRQGRGVPASVVDDAIRNGTASPGKTPGTTRHRRGNSTVVIVGQGGKVITVYWGATMDASTQANLILGAAGDYQAGTMLLSMLIHKVEGVAKVMDDPSFHEALLDHILALEEVYALSRTGDIDFERHGRPVVDAAVAGIAVEAKRFLHEQDLMVAAKPGIRLHPSGVRLR